VSKQYWKKPGCGVIEGRVIHPKADVIIQKRGCKFEIIVEKGDAVTLDSVHDRLLDAVTACASRFTMVLW
jgi:hypothetical protein